MHIAKQKLHYLIISTKHLIHSKSCDLWQSVFLCFSGIDKITEKSQVSEDGTMVAVPHSDSPQADSGAVAGASDTESNSERDAEVQKKTHLTISLCFRCYVFVFLHLLYSVNRFSPQSRKQRGVACQASHRQQPGALIQTGWGEVFFIIFLRFSCTWWEENTLIYDSYFVRFCHGRQNFLYRPSCGFYKCWFLRWRRFASTSKK